MKRFFAITLSLFYILSTNAVFAFSDLYYIENTNTNTISYMVKNSLISKNYNIKKENPYYAISQKDSQDYAVVVLKQSGNNVLYYYESNDDNKRLNKNILKSFKKNNYTYNKLENHEYLNSFSQIASNTVLGKTNKYTFETPKEEINIKTTNSEPDNSKLTGYVTQIPAGTILEIYLQTSLNTSNAQKGDTVSAILKTNWMYNKYTIAPQGSVLYGYVTKAHPASIGTRNGAVSFVFNKLITPNGKTIDINTEAVNFNVSDDGKVQRIASKALVTALIGAALGVGLAALGDRSGSSLAKGAIIGASLGGGGALATSACERGIDAEIPSYTELEIELSKSVTVVLNN